MYYTGAIKTYIDRYTNRVFTEVASTSYWYDGDRTNTLEIDDFTDVNFLEEYDRDGESIYAFDPEDYELIPRNTIPKTAIKIINGKFLGYQYKVTGTRGYSVTCPNDIEYAAQLITENLAAQDGGLQSENIEGYSYTIGNVVESNPVVKGILDSYKKILI